MSTTRPLPPTPNLEFERKDAKHLLRQLRADDASALARVQAMHPDARGAAAERFTLADAQLTLAREYGFANWPRLVRYFGTADRQRHRNHSNLGSVAGYEHDARSLLAGHAKRRTRIGRMLAEYIPRFFGVPLDEVFRAAVTEDEAKHALARDAGFPSWTALVASANDAVEQHGDAWAIDPARLAITALHRVDLPQLQHVVRDHPALLHPTQRETARNGGLLNFALGAERERGVDAMRPIMAWLGSHGHDIAARRTAQLCGSSFMSAADVRSLLERGADPAWVAPNGLSVLEHALLRYQSGECVDLIAQRVIPPRALWIAAGLGDVERVATFLDASGTPTADARGHRPLSRPSGHFRGRRTLTPPTSRSCSKPRMSPPATGACRCWRTSSRAASQLTASRGTSLCWQWRWIVAGCPRWRA